ncbi:DUF411 domain-containing protein [Cognatazoarcus halotolerans]|uniref:DUF411 domain-containing protein n=1 Tax=Cognatazoarcus halotolerans TaxID=2686016 RepID=UPI001357407F|nr:DUF411 domain-containing protein [Cognatazoarcus halotolerans]MCB1901466.1 DUF411 domain-containing protein [Rhodocyclaceae bacterium]MCP5308152.1 DUF411 domain-containing protein [Zoogloeaceae bacterium]
MKNGKFAGVLVALCLSAGFGQALASEPEITMFKDPGCGCCGKWAEHMRANGFAVREVPSREMSAIKRQMGVPERLGSCHTARIGKYVIEGHVPAADVKRLLAEGADVAGLSAPGMPAGSPGMESSIRADQYEVVSFDRAGNATVFARH